MTTSMGAFRPVAARHSALHLLAPLALVAFAGPFWASSLDAAIAYFFLTVAAFLPSVLWLRNGMRGMPIWPAVAATSWIFYGLPILRDQEAQTVYPPAAVLFLAVTVVLFLVSATIASTLAAFTYRRRLPRRAASSLSTHPLTPMVFLGLVLAIPASLLLWFIDLGAFYGTVRSAILTSTVVSSYMLGCARGNRSLRGWRWALALVALAANVLYQWSALFLIQGIFLLVAAGAGYMIASRRFPWKTSFAAILVLTVLHAGKSQMRQQYWAPDANYSTATGVLHAPALLAEWFEAGLTTLASGDSTNMVIDRATLFGLLLRVQDMAPRDVPFLNGDTYSLLPRLLVPRFLVHDKPVSQEAMSILNVRFGLMTLEQTRITAIGWGLIPEAFANFGLTAVIGVGVIVGAIAGLFTRWTYGATPTSPGTFLGIVALMTLVNAEADFSYLMTNLWQSCASAVIFMALLRAVFPRKCERPGDGPQGSSHPECQHGELGWRC